MPTRIRYKLTGSELLRQKDVLLFWKPRRTKKIQSHLWTGYCVPVLRNIKYLLRQLDTKDDFPEFMEGLGPDLNI